MRKITILILNLFILFFFCSCVSTGDPIIRDNDSQIANEKFEELIEAIQNKDEDALFALFLPRARSEEFSQHAGELFAYYSGTMLSYDDWGGGSVQAEYEQGYVRKIMETSYEVKQQHVSIVSLFATLLEMAKTRKVLGLTPYTLSKDKTTPCWNMPIGETANLRRVFISAFKIRNNENKGTVLLCAPK